MARKKIESPVAETDELHAPADATHAPEAGVAEVAAQEPSGASAGLPSTNTEMSITMDKVMKSAEEFMSFGQGNMEAIIEASQIWAAGVQDLSKSFAATAQAQMDATMSNLKALAAVKNIKDAVELQSTLARSSVEAAVTEASKMTDASMKLAEQAIAPITARVTLAVEKFGRAA
jgi:phasin family protein